MIYDPGRHADYHAGVGGTMPLAFRIIFGALVIGAFVALAAAARADDQHYSNRQTWRDVRHDQRRGELGSCALVGTGCAPVVRFRSYPDHRPSGVMVYGYRAWLPPCKAPWFIGTGRRCLP